MISRAGLPITGTQTFKPSGESYGTAKEYMADPAKKEMQGIQDAFMAQDGSDFDLDGAKGSVELSDFPMPFGVTGWDGRGATNFSGTASADELNFSRTYESSNDAGTWFGSMSSSEDGGTEILTARHYGVQDNPPNFQLTTLNPNGTITIQSGVPTAEFDSVMGVKGTQPYYGELEGLG